MNKKDKTNVMLEMINRSRPRPQVRPRPVVFEDKTKYRRSRAKAELRKEIYI